MQQTLPPVHCASVVQPHAPALHAWVVVSQQLPAVQSLLEQQAPAAHWPRQQTWPDPQSALALQPHAVREHACVAVSQHCPATQS